MTSTLTAAAQAGQPAIISAELRALRGKHPPRPVTASWKATRMDRGAVLACLLAPPFLLDSPSSRNTRRYGLIRILDWLQAQPGQTWQERWNTSGIDTGGQADARWKDKVRAWLVETGRIAPGNSTIRTVLGAGLVQLMCGDVIRPSISWLLTIWGPVNLAAEMTRVRDPGGFAALKAANRGSVVSDVVSDGAYLRIAAIMAAKGGMVADITVGDCVELLDKSLEYGQNYTGGRGPYFYQLLHAIGVFPDGAPPTARMLSPVYQGQLTPAQLIDRYDLACRPVRDLLVDYLQERQPGIDYSTLTRLAAHLGLLFWKDLENHHPGIESLSLAPDAASAWKYRIQTKPALASDSGATTGRVPRADVTGCLHTVRAFYLDIAQWAADEPARWGPWAASCPIRPADIPDRKERARRKSRMDQRTRERLPAVLATAVALDQARIAAAALLAAARQAGHGEHFTAAAQTMRRLVMPTSDQRIWAEDATGTRRNLTLEEDQAFWAWAAVEVLRHTGIRAEELTELSHHSLVQHRLPDTGELIPLLHIAPSKTDEERLLVVSPELADVLATILQRVRTPDGTVPLVAAYDREKVWNPPMPLLFQHRIGMENRPFATAGISRLLRMAFARAAITGPGGKPLSFVQHDFRRIFATEAMLNGMPPHIAQVLLGHKDINVTMGYKAVYPEEAISGHRAFIARRRDLRPSEEYRTPTDEEWDEFLGHFQHRRLALGDCGRAYGTSCIHEHSCIRCPMLRVDPAQRPRLEAIRDNLTARIAEAETEGWTGEAAGLKISLAAASAKLAQADMLSARRAAAVSLGMPAYRDIAGSTAVTSESQA